MIVIYDSRVVPDLNPYYDSRVVNYERKLFIRLATGHTESAVRLQKTNLILPRSTLIFWSEKFLILILAKEL